ncbi:MAG: NAD(P)/FAD-dependent oxidoreductase [Desulfobacterales bacterium]
MLEYDVVVIGSGTAGQTAAYRLSKNGLSVALVEKSDYPGGTCALSGCQPKKWFYEMTEVVARSKHLKEKGIVALPEISWASILEQKNRFVHGIPDSTVEGLIEAGIDFIEGNAHFAAPDVLELEDQRLKAKFFVLATGAKPMSLPFDGNQYLITNRDFLNLNDLPGRICFIGGGFISFEFAHFAARLGPEKIKPVIIEVSDRPLGPFDSEMVRLLVEASRADGIQIYTGVDIQSVEKNKTGYTVKSKSGDQFETDLVVHGAGRKADIEDLNLESAGIEASGKGIEVDSYMRTSNPKVFAIGDCVAGIQLARVADYEAQVAADNILAELKKNEPASIDYAAVPFLLFTYPQYAMVGKTEDSLKKEGVEYRKSFGKNLRWPTYRRVGLDHAAYKILTGPDSRILGAHILSDNASGLINTIKMAMTNDISARQLYQQSIMTPYPTRESDLIYMLDTFK